MHGRDRNADGSDNQEGFNGVGTQLRRDEIPLTPFTKGGIYEGDGPGVKPCALTAPQHIGRAKIPGATFRLNHWPSEVLPDRLLSSTMTLPRRMVITG